MDIDQRVVSLLADRHPAKARDLMLDWAERRNASWADASREAQTRAASGGHLPQIRGQLRYHLGEVALAESARHVGAGVIPFRTTPPGGVFAVARVGRFALVSVAVPYPGLMPRKSLTRRILSQANEAIEPQARLFETGGHGVVTELAYFGCLAAVPSSKDPAAPAILALGIPNAAVTEWISWIPSHRLHAYLQERVDDADRDHGTAAAAAPISDEAFPTFRVPKKDNAADETGGSD